MHEMYETHEICEIHDRTAEGGMAAGEGAQ